MKHPSAIAHFLVLIGVSVSTTLWIQPFTEAIEPITSDLEVVAEDLLLFDTPDGTVALEELQQLNSANMATSLQSLPTNQLPTNQLPTDQRLLTDESLVATDISLAQPSATIPVPGTVSTSAATLQVPAPEALLAQDTPATPAPTVVPVVSNPAISVNGRSYVGAGVNIGVAGDTAIGNTSFAAFSKVALTNYLSVRPAIFVSSNVTFLVPITYDFPLVRAGAIHFNPYVGAGISISTRNESVDFLVTGGLDFPISDRLTATAAANFGPAGGVDVGLVFGLAYTFGPE
ncbi:MAG: hypothetical protein NW220_08270 [Leptolyngbyaceae cyanobacterium bins.349]|nr:hypothetical protein [Leptolyngbyaceae cyanobacterium bins.349]